MLPRRKMLGLAVTGRCITAVEAAAVNGGGRLTRAVALPLPEAGADTPAALGRKLRQFLRRNGFSASRCVIGVEARRLTARTKALPPAAGETAAGILSLAVEQEFAADRKDLVFDYVLGASDAGGPTALLVAGPRQMVDDLTTMARAAGLTAAGVTASMLALVGAAGATGDGDQIVLHLFGGGAELALRGPGGLRGVRSLAVRIPIGADGEAPWNNGHTLRELGDELHRVVALLPGSGAAGGTGCQILVCDETGLTPSHRDALSQQLGLPVRPCARPDGLNPPADARGAGSAQFAAAATLALAGLRGGKDAIDLLHSRLTPRRRVGFGRPAAWAVALGVTVLIAAAAFVLDWRRDRLEVQFLAARLKDVAADRDQAKDLISKVTFARPWYDRRPSYLDCVRELTRAFPQEGLIWATSLAVAEDMKVVVSGKAASESAVLDVLDRLKANPRLSEVKPLYLRQTTRQGSDVAFAMSFAFNPGQPWSSPSENESSSPRR